MYKGMTTLFSDRGTLAIAWSHEITNSLKTSRNEKKKKKTLKLP